MSAETPKTAARDLGISLRPAVPIMPKRQHAHLIGGAETRRSRPLAVGEAAPALAGRGEVPRRGYVNHRGALRGTRSGFSDSL
jgi:hypothetical protein